MDDDARRILRAARGILLVDWPSRNVPDSLARAGYDVVVKGGPEPDHFSVYVVSGSEVVARRTSRRPERADLVYVHRPLAELPGWISLAQEVGATAVWYQSGLTENGARDPKGWWLSPEEAAEARRLVEAAGLQFVSDSYIVAALSRPRG